MSEKLQPGQRAPDEPRSMQESVATLLHVLWRRRRWLLREAAIAFLALTAIVLLIPSEYQSTARLIPPDAQPSLASMAMSGLGGLPSAASAGLASSLLGARTPGATAVAFLQSRSVQDKLIDRFDLRKVYGYSRYQDARKKLARNTSVVEDRRSGVITLDVTDRNAVRAKALAEAYVAELDEVFTRLSTSTAQRERVFLEERLTIVKRDLDAAYRQLSEFSSRNATFDAQNQTKAMIDAGAKLQGELIVAESELKALEPVYASDNVRSRSARMRVEELRRQLKKLGGTGNQGSNEIELYPSLRQMPILGATYIELHRNAKALEATYEVLKKQETLAKLEERRQVPSMKVLDTPDLPERKSFPPRALIIVLGTLLAVGAGALYVLIQAARNESGYLDPIKAVRQERQEPERVQAGGRGAEDHA